MRFSRPTIASAVLACSLVLALAACGGGGDSPGGGGGAGGTGGTGGVAPGGSGGTGGDGGTGGEGGCGTLPSIAALEPDHGAVGDRIWVVGCNFHATPNKNEIWFNGTKSAVFEVTDGGTRLRTAVPMGATSGGIRLLVDGVRVDGPVFTIDVVDPPPATTGLTPDHVTEYRTGGAETITLTISGTGFIPQSHVYMAGLGGSERLMADECHYSSPTSMQCTLGKDLFLAPQTMRFKVVNEREGIPGGGTSEWQTFAVVGHIDLVSAFALTEKHVGLIFSRNVGGGTWGFGFSPNLDIARADVGSNRSTVIVQLGAAMRANTTYQVSVHEGFESDQGGAIWNRTASFRGFGSLPYPQGVYGAVGGGCGVSAFQRPGGISVADGQVFVTEREGQQVQVMTPTGSFVGFYGYDGSTAGLHTGTEDALGCPTGGSSAAGALKNPRGKVAVDNITGDRIVADTGNGRMLRYTEAGEYKSEFGAAHTMPVIAAQLGSQIFVADVNDQLRVMTGTGSTQGSFGGPGTDDGQFSFAVAQGGVPTVVSSGTYLYIAEPGNHRIQRLKASDLSPTGWVGVGHVTFQIQGVCCQAGTGQAEFTNIRGLGLDVAGFLWVADEVGGGRLQRLNPDGGYAGITLNLGYIPGGVVIDNDNALWISDETTNTVHKYQL